MLMRKNTVALVALAALWGVASTAQAVTIEVQYNLSGVVTALGALPIGPPSTGTMKVSYSATGPSPGAIVHGPVHLLSYSFSQVMNLPLVGLIPVLLTGNSNYTAPASALGTLNATGLAIGPMLLNMTGFVHCNGVGTPGVNTGCLSGGATKGGSPNTLPFPNSIPVPIATSFPGALLFSATGAASGPGATVTFANVFAGFMSIPGFPPITLTIPALVGTEVARTYVPEPSSLSLVGLGLAGIAGFAARLRRG